MSTIINPDGSPAGQSAGTPEAAKPIGGDGGNFITEGNTDSFAADVLDASMEAAVVVDFWAPWCGPCKQLGPLLEKLVNEYGGAVRLVKINVDENQALAQQLRVQSIPMVYAFKDGRPVDAFTGALPESQLRQFFQRITGDAGSALDEALEQAAQILESGDTEQASAIYNQILSHDAENAAAHAGIAKCLMAAGDMDRARDYIGGLADKLKLTPEITAVTAKLDLSEKSVEAGDVAELRAKVAAAPDDHQARFDLALALYGGRDAEGAVDELIRIVERDRNWNDEAARKQLVEIFDALGGADPVTVEGRRKLSRVLFS